MSGRTVDADQRLTHDVDKLTSDLASLVTGLFKPSVDILWYFLFSNFTGLLLWATITAILFRLDTIYVLCNEQLRGGNEIYTSFLQSTVHLLDCEKQPTFLFPSHSSEIEPHLFFIIWQVYMENVPLDGKERSCHFVCIHASWFRLSENSCSRLR